MKKIENGGEPDQRASTVIFCEYSLSTISLSKCLSVFLSVSLTNSHVGRGGGDLLPVLPPPITPFVSLQRPSVISLLFIYVLSWLLLLLLLLKYSPSPVYTSLYLIFRPLPPHSSSFLPLLQLIAHSRHESAVESSNNKRCALSP